MRKLLLLLAVIALAQLLNAQTFVSTLPENKKVILEEFTGTGCPNCPDGHTVAAGILAANPGTVFVVAYHPTNSSYTASDPMKNAWSNAFYTQPWISPTQRFMPSAIVNRRVWGGVERILSRAVWAADADVIKAEPSPVNVGVQSTYNTTTNTLEVTVEVYFTGDVTSTATLYTMFTEDGIIATQSGGTSPYTHKHTFRAALPGGATAATWGDTIAGPTTMGSFKTYTFTFDNTTTAYNMANCEVLAFVRDASNDEIISGNGAPVGHSSTVGIDDVTSAQDTYAVYPNPLTESSVLRLNLTKSTDINYNITDMLGHTLEMKNLGEMSAGNHCINLGSLTLAKGVYSISIFDGMKTTTLRVIK